MNEQFPAKMIGKERRPNHPEFRGSAYRPGVCVHEQGRRGIVVSVESYGADTDLYGAKFAKGAALRAAEADLL
jgi:hypothetical protein